MSTSIRHVTRDTIRAPLVQISLDLTSVADALATAAVAAEAGVDWIEVGTPLVLAEGLHAVRALRKEFPTHSLVVDLKTMDGGGLEAQMMAEAGADAVIVMGRAHDATITQVCTIGEKYGLLVMGDDLAAPDRVAEAVRMQRLGVGMVVHHIGYDHRNMHPGGPTPLTQLPEIVAATTVPVQAVGGLSIEQAIGCPGAGAPVVVFGAPLAIDGKSFTAAGGDLLGVLTDACHRVHNADIHYPSGRAVHS
jgi:3-hexulose-6-phosphate synthase/6-phospho-3-hexuloisomerase